ncbi:MAG TPA: NUDIX domain-containing protein [Candidatus Hodarchaeales archaeon]|nr:NUDIX domain-containing protein [Candidatus Hodarchaeales archaeon]
MKTKYVCGFLFDMAFKHVALINKVRPDWQKGKLNGIGGKVEPRESLDAAMAREFEEEAGRHFSASTWKMFAEIEGSDWVVYFFFNVSDAVFLLESKTDEKVEVIEVDTLNNNDRVIQNLKWLIPMTMDKHHLSCKAESR